MFIILIVDRLALTAGHRLLVLLFLGLRLYRSSIGPVTNTYITLLNRLCLIARSAFILRADWAAFCSRDGYAYGY